MATHRGVLDATSDPAGDAVSDRAVAASARRPAAGPGTAERRGSRPPAGWPRSAVPPGSRDGRCATGRGPRRAGPAPGRSARRSLRPIPESRHHRQARPTVRHPGRGVVTGLPLRTVASCPDRCSEPKSCGSRTPTCLSGRGTFIDNLVVPGLLHLAFVRSPHAHAPHQGRRRRRGPGPPRRRRHLRQRRPRHRAVPLVRDGAERRLRPAPTGRRQGPLRGRPGRRRRGRERGAGRRRGRGGRSSTTSRSRRWSIAEAALAPGAPVQFDAIGSNLAAGLRDRDEIDPLDGADVVVRGRFVNQRIAVVPMEGNAIAVIPGDDGQGHELTVYVSTQMPHLFRRLACALLGMPEEAMRVITPHVGGGFGGKAGITAEHAVALAVARRLGRPVKWVETRSENLVALPHGRSQVQYIEMGFTPRRGDRRHARPDRRATPARTAASAAAWPWDPPARWPKASTASRRSPTTSPSPSPTPRRWVRSGGPDDRRRRPSSSGSWTWPPTSWGSTRSRSGAGTCSPPISSPTRRSWAPPTTSATTPSRWSGPSSLSGYEELLAEQAARRQRGDRWQLGIGVSTYVEITAGGMSSEYGSVEVHEDGTVTVKAGTSAHGQGHATSFAMIVADRLHVPIESIRFVQSDTALVPRGAGTGGSRSLQIGGTAVARRGRGGGRSSAELLAARLLEADEDDIVVGDDGRVGVAGVPARALDLGRAGHAAKADGGERRPAGRRARRRPRPAPRSPSAPTSRWSRSTSRPGRSGWSGTSRSTTAAGS